MSDLEQFAMPDTAPEPPPDDGNVPIEEPRYERKERARSASVADLTLEAGLPANVDAEKTILGAVLLDNAAFSEASETLNPDDFSLDSHRRIFLRMSELIDAQKTVDIVTLAEELARYKEVESIGGVAYLASLTEGLPRRPVIGDYIRIVRDKAMLRRMMGVCSAAIARAADQSEEALSVLEFAESSLLDIAQEANTGKLRTIYDSVKEAGGTEPYLKAYTDPELKPGLLTGFVDLDRMTGGLQKSELTIIAARPSMGKALRMDCMIKTVDGWKSNKDLKIGDLLASVDGGPSMVTGLFPQGIRQLFKVMFSDGRTIECDGDHLWSVYYRAWDQPRTLRTIEIKEMLKRQRYASRLWIETADGDFGDEAELPLNPWALGALLGNGCMTEIHGSITFSSRDAQTIANLAGRLPRGCEMKQSSKYDWRINGVDADKRSILRAILEKLKIMGKPAGQKSIPSPYLNASRASRVALLQGLMDTDGNVEKTGSLVYSTSSPQLAEDVQELARSLGALATISVRSEPRYKYKGKSRTGQRAYRVYICHPRAVEFVSLPRKKERAARIRRIHRLTVSSVTPSRRMHAQCISVSHPSHLYIATRGYIVTHNTALGLNIAENVACGTDAVVAIFSLEMSRLSLERRFMASRARVHVRRAMEGIYLGREEKVKLETALMHLIEANIFIDDSPVLTPVQLRAKARRLKTKQGRLDLLLVDYLQLMSAGQRFQSREQEIASISRSLKACAKELECPVVAMAQLNRQSEQRTDKRPMLSDLRESGQIEQDADVVIFIHRPAYYERDEDASPEEKALAEIVIGKQRSGATGIVRLCFIDNITRFENLAR